MGPPRHNSSFIDSPTAMLTKPNTAGMTHASRYYQNLKVLRRRDPSITSIFDQFSHVCLYHHTGTKWEKQGFEGSMFLYERDSYPPYGFYILNRMGMDDHIQPIHPEDTVGNHGSYLIIRSFPEFTNRRLAAARASNSKEALTKFSDAYLVHDVESLTPADKGDSRTIGLWMFSPDSRGPLIDTFSRLHGYIKKNEPYPEEFRYGPDRPPPSMTPAILNQQPNAHGSTLSLPSTPSVTIFNSQPTPNGGGLSDLDKLFAKLAPTPLLSAAMAANTASPPPSASTSTGPKLLDTIFASASASSSHSSHSHSHTPTSSNSLQIQAPLPTSGTAPQVLDQTTIAALLGLPPSRTTSAASTAYSTDHDARSSHSSSREGDNEDEDTSDSGCGYSGFGHIHSHIHNGAGEVSDTDGYSESSTVLDPDAEFDTELQAAGASAGRPLIAEPTAATLNGHGHGHGHGRANGRNGHGHRNGPVHGHGRVNGDVTPRPPMNGFIAPPTFSRHQNQNHAALGQAAAFGRQKHPNQNQNQNQRAPLGTERALVPFEPDSELWPYPTTTTGTGQNYNNNHLTPNINGNGMFLSSEGENDDDEIIELDFEDTSALSDPDAFRRRHTPAHPNGYAYNDANGTAAGTSGAGAPATAAATERKRVRTKRKMTRKERAAEHAREREEIERSWDAPASNTNGNLNANSDHYYDNMQMPEPMSPEPCPSPEPVPLRSGSVVGRNPNGNGHKQTLRKKEKQKQKEEAVYPELMGGQRVVPEAVRDSVIEAAVAVGKVEVKAAAALIERNEFVREVLMLIHTDKAFVDSLYKEYTSRVA